MADKFTWLKFYIELANKLLLFKNNRTLLVEKLREAHKVANKELPKIESDNNNVPDMDPFTVFALFNRGSQSVETRIELCKAYKEVFELEESVPSDFYGVPIYNYNQYCFYRYLDNPKRNNKCFDILWDLFQSAIKYADYNSNEDDFKKYFEEALKLDVIGLGKLTMGLFQIRPNTFVNLDSANEQLIKEKTVTNISIDSGSDYIGLCNKVLDYIKNNSDLKTLAEFSYLAYINKKTKGVKEAMDNKNNETKKQTNIAKNIILYGPLGTGKTYNTVLYAVAIIEKKDLDTIKNESYEDVIKRYNDYKSKGQIEFTTFHQSYAYEDFIEGIKPLMYDEDEEHKGIEYEISQGLFKKFCDRASNPILKQDKDNIVIDENATIWKVSLEGSGDNLTRTDCMENDHIRVGFNEYGENITDETDFSKYGGKGVLKAFIYRMKIGDIVLSCYSSTLIDAIGIVTGEYEWHDEYKVYKRLRKVKWIVKNIREDISKFGTKMSPSSVYRMSISLNDVMSIISKHSQREDKVKDNDNNYVFVIDEINRGNISKIFGELITLIEAPKRKGQVEAASAKLPYSKKDFAVPDNVYLIGTMNTADRSIATIDTALRRRFHFKEMQPNPNVLDGINVEGVSIKEMLTRMNQKISVLFDREHTIGHAYFMPLKNDNSLNALAEIFENNIIPLLQEYFYDDYEKIRLVLGDNKKDESEQFILKKSTNYMELFGDTDVDFEESFSYEINKGAFYKINAYKYI